MFYVKLTTLKNIKRGFKIKLFRKRTASELENAHLNELFKFLHYNECSMRCVTYTPNCIQRIQDKNHGLQSRHIIVWLFTVKLWMVNQNFMAFMRNLKPDRHVQMTFDNYLNITVFTLELNASQNQRAINMNFSLPWLLFASQYAAGMNPKVEKAEIMYSDNKDLHLYVCSQISWFNVSKMGQERKGDI